MCGEVLVCHSSRQSTNPPIQFLTDHILDITFILRCDVLLLQRRRRNVTIAIHSLLQAIVLPPEDIISVRAPARSVAGGPCEGLTNVSK
jgi:hypothetical protein